MQGRPTFYKCHGCDLSIYYGVRLFKFSTLMYFGVVVGVVRPWPVALQEILRVVKIRLGVGYHVATM